MTPWKLASGSEHSHQRAFFAWLNMAANYGLQTACQHEAYANKTCAENIQAQFREPPRPGLLWAHAIPNGGDRDKRTAAKLKAEGVTPGVHDVFVPVAKPRPFEGHPEDKYHGLYIEFKKPSERTHKNGGMSNAQVDFQAHIITQGYKSVVAYTWIEAANCVLEYYGESMRIEE